MLHAAARITLRRLVLKVAPDRLSFQVDDGAGTEAGQRREALGCGQGTDLGGRGRSGAWARLQR